MLSYFTDSTILNSQILHVITYYHMYGTTLHTGSITLSDNKALCNIYYVEFHLLISLMMTWSGSKLLLSQFLIFHICDFSIIISRLHIIIPTCFSKLWYVISHTFILIYLHTYTQNINHALIFHSIFFGCLLIT